MLLLILLLISVCIIYYLYKNPMSCPKPETKECPHPESCPEIKECPIIDINTSCPVAPSCPSCPAQVTCPNCPTCPSSTTTSSTSATPTSTTSSTTSSTNSVNGHNFAYQGCYIDDNTRILPTLITTGVDYMGCAKAAQSKGYTYFGSEFPTGGECYASNTTPNLTRLGKSTSDCAPNGASWRLALYKFTS